MTCDDADRLWQDVLDARGDGHPPSETRIAEHASSCPRCGVVAARYQLFRSALAAWEPPPAPSPHLESRFLAAVAATRPRPALVPARRSPWLAPALAASILAVAWLGARPPAPKPTPRRPEVHIHLASALADATSATLDLARGVSGPAARIGRDVLDLEGEDAEAGPAVLVADQTPDASDLLRSVGDRLDAGARPLSGTAMHAFGFLLPATAEADRPPPPGEDEARRLDQ